MNIEEYQIRWNEKPVLREIYADLYDKIENVVCLGDTLEIGGGIGNLRLIHGNIIKIDIQYFSGINVVTDAHNLPFAGGVFANIILFDVLHHLQCPLQFFAEAKRVLCPGGRVIFVEPGITPVSKLLYKVGHQEIVDMRWDIRVPCEIKLDRDPYDSNQAIPTILFKRKPQLFYAEVDGLKIKSSEWLSLFAYPLSGGFKSWSMIPQSWVSTILKLECKLLPLLGHIMAFRLMVVLEKDKDEV